MKDFFIALVFLSIGTYAFTRLLVFIAMRLGLIEVIDDASVPSVTASLPPRCGDAEGLVATSNGSVYLVVATSGDGKRFELSRVDPYATDVGHEIDIDTILASSASTEMLVYEATPSDGLAANVASTRWRGDRGTEGLASTPFAFAA
ncbi:hypothetical protein [Achromobacter mucicolens]|uniref:hypothetical protein n=1 Tax=Achromobacter mucicolens TaxID=1389922 RepID=UPI003974ADCD